MTRWDGILRNQGRNVSRVVANALLKKAHESLARDVYRVYTTIQNAYIFYIYIYTYEYIYIHMNIFRTEVISY